MSDNERADSPPRMPRRGRNADDPRMIGPWKVGRTIGKGASGRVKIARHAKTGKYAAVKIISKTQLANSRRSIHNLAQDAERILLGMEREIVLMKLIDHPNIMQLYDVYETSGELYLILEYIEGGELFDYICDRGRLQSLEALDYFQQLMSAVEYCQRFKISHRDLKPENLLLNKEKILKVADFGMAAWQGGGTDLLETSCGSPHYAAPEVIIGKPYDGCSADIWSCGVILYALLAGRLPFDAQDVDQLLDKIKVGKFSMPSDIDPLAKDLISQMLEINVQKRIKLCEIVRHPWFTSAKPRVLCEPPPSLEDLAKPVSSSDEIDVDILGNLRVLWQGVDDSQLIEGLTNSEENWEKIIYHLLVSYRTKHLENYKEELERARSLRKSQRSKTGKRPLKSKTNDRQVPPDRPRTPLDHYPPRPDPPTPRRAAIRAQGTVCRARNDPPPLPPPPAVSPLRPVEASPHGRRPLPSPGPTQSDVLPGVKSLQPPTSPLATLVSPASPIWEALDIQPPINVINSPEFQDDNVQKYFQQVMDRLNLMQNRQNTEQSKSLQALLSPNIAVSPRPAVHEDPRSPKPDRNIRAKKDRPQSLHVPPNTFGLGLVSSPKSPAAVSEASSSSGKENDRPSRLQKKSSLKKRDANEDTSSQPRTPLSGRHVQIVLPPRPDRDRDRNQSPSNLRSAMSPISPAFSISEGSSSSFVSGQPKRSWFGNLFNFKPATFHLLSMRDPDETRETCTKALELIGVHIAVIAAPPQAHANTNEDQEWRGTATLKCHYEDDRDPMGLMSMTKTVAFRVEVHPPSDVQAAMGYTCVVDLTQEKGAQSTLKLIYATLRRDWTLDTQSVAPVPILSPVLPAVPRFVEEIDLYD